MFSPMSIDSASKLLAWSNRIYVFGAILTFTSAAMVLYEKRSKNQGREVRWGLATEIIVIVAAFICLCGTIGAISFGNIVSHLKDIDLASYKKSADLQIAQANESARKAEQDAGISNQKAEEARLKADTVEQENGRLRIDVAKGQAESRKAEKELATQQQTTNQFVQGLAQQQQTMGQQMQAVPSLSDLQINAIAEFLKPFSGKPVFLNMMVDAHCQRLGAQIHQALERAGLKIVNYTTIVGPIYNGIQIMVRNPTPQAHPPLADALWRAFGSVGLRANGVFDKAIPEDQVGIGLGPQ